MSKDYLNPNDADGHLTGQEAFGVVVDVNDPEELGRIKVRLIGLQDKDRVPDDKLPWVQCMYNNEPSSRGTGYGPPNYAVGSKVFLKSLGNQGHLVSGSVPNTEESKEKADLPEDAKSNTPRIPFIREVGENYNKLQELLEMTGTKAAYDLINGKFQTKWEETDDENYHAPRIDQAQTPDHYLNRKISRAVDKLSIGVEQFAGEIKNAQTFIKDKIGEAGSLIPGSLDMINNLYKVTDPRSVPLPTNVIGQDNILKALQGILQFFNDNKNNDKEEDEPLVCENIENLEERKKCREVQCKLIRNDADKNACLLRAQELYEQEVEQANAIASVESSIEST